MTTHERETWMAARRNSNWECFKGIAGGLMMLAGSLAGVLFAVSRAGSTELCVGYLVGSLTVWGLHLWIKAVDGD